MTMPATMPSTMVSGATEEASGGGGSAGEPGQALRLGEDLGQGAVATVVLVTDEHGHRFAGKILHASHGHDDAAKARFAQEGQLARDVVDDNVVRVYGRREIEGRDVLLMELVDGEDLGTFIARHGAEGIAIDEVVALLDGIAAGLAAAHAAGIVHRDLKPSNVLLSSTDDGAVVPKIADFGMARASSLAGVGSDAMTVLGTPDYMAPESLDPLAVDGRTDLYALGCIAFELCSGHPPYSAATPFGVLQAHRSEPIPALPERVPPRLAELVASLLAKSPADRPQAAEAVREHLAALGGPVTALALTDAGSDRCSRCSGPLVPGLAVCLGCGQSAVLLEDGAASVVVTGPGEIGDKLDSALRDRLVRWLEASPRLGLSATKALEGRIPRVPFTLVRGVSEPTADAIVQSLQPLGLVAQATPGPPAKLPAMSKKIRSMAGRGAAVAAGTIASMSGTMAQNPWMLVAGLLAFLVVIGVVVGRTLASGTKRTHAKRTALPPPVQAALGRVEKAAPGIEHARHREALRAVVGRVLALAPDQAGGDPERTEELATAIDAATAAAGRLDTLDRQLAERGMSEASEATRALLHERDTWSARLLRLSATLESIGVRTAVAKAKAGDADDDAALDDLRAQVEALEEVQDALGSKG